MKESKLKTLLEALKQMHGCTGTLREVIPVIERKGGQVVWAYNVAVFDVEHPEASTAWAWFEPVPWATHLRTFPVLCRPPVSTVNGAVRKVIEFREETEPEIWAHSPLEPGRPRVEFALFSANRDETNDLETGECTSGLILVGLSRFYNREASKEGVKFPDGFAVTFRVSGLAPFSKVRFGLHVRELDSGEGYIMDDTEYVIEEDGRADVAIRVNGVSMDPVGLRCSLLYSDVVHGELSVIGFEDYRPGPI